jgi:hypothetical protein
VTLLTLTPTHFVVDACRAQVWTCLGASLLRDELQVLLGSAMGWVIDLACFVFVLLLGMSTIEQCLIRARIKSGIRCDLPGDSWGSHVLMGLCAVSTAAVCNKV